MLNVYYEKSYGCWVAFYTDDIGQLGESEFAKTRDDAVYQLGFEKGRHPEKFARPMSEYFEKENQKLDSCLKAAS